MKTILLLILGIFLCGINNTVIGQPKTKTTQKALAKKPVSVSKAKGKTNQALTPDSIRICGISVVCKDSTTVRNTVEYHLNNGIIYIREYYPDKQLKSESYWINDIIPVYHIKHYNEDGSIKGIIDKKIGKYDLCDLLTRISKNSVLRDREINISISNKSKDRNKSWYVTYDHSEYKFGSDAKGIYYDCETGGATPGGYSISQQLANLVDPTPDQLPTYPGGIEKFEKYINDNLNIPTDSLINSKVIVFYSVDPSGIVGNFQTQGSTNYLNKEVLKLAKKMPNWIPAKETTTTGACNVKGDNYGKYTFALYVYFRRFD